MVSSVLQVVQEELAEFREGLLPNSRIIWQGGGDVLLRDLLTVLEAKITERIMGEI